MLNGKQIWLAVAFILIAFLSANLGYRHVKKRENEVVVSSSGPEGKVSGMASGERPMEVGALPMNRASAEDVFAELREAARTRDKDSLRRLRKGWVAQCTPEELESLIALVDSDSDSVWRGIMMEAIAGKWAQLDPEAAIQFMTIRVIRGQRQNGLARIFDVLASKDPVAAFALIEGTSEAAGHPSNMQPSTEAVFKAWKKRDSAAAFAAVEMLDEGALRWSALHALCRVEREEERQQLFKTIDSIDSSSLKRDAWKQAIRHWAEDAPFEEVVDWIGARTFEGNLASRLEREAAIRHASDDPEAMANWLVERADSDSLPGHVEAAVHFWAADQPNACGEWLHEIGLGPQTDRAVEAYARTIIDHDAPSAFAWAQSIVDEEKRAHVLEQVSGRFYRFDPRGFLETVETSSLPEADRLALVEKIQKRAEFR